MTPLLSIVIVNSDGEHDTLRCIETIDVAGRASLAARFPGAEFEVVLVDNCSRDACLKRVREGFPWVHIVQAPQRQGFAKNYNLGIHHTHGDFILVLNNDTLIQEESLPPLIEAAQQHGYGVVGPRLISATGATQTDCARALPTPAGYVLEQTVLDNGLPLGMLRQRWLRWQIERRPAGAAPCISGACMLVRRTALEEVGPLDEGFTFYYEDVEWCHRFQLRGWLVGYEPAAVVTHLGDQSLTKVKVRAKQSEYLSAVRYFRAYHSGARPPLNIVRLATTVHYLTRGLAFVLAEAFGSRPGHARAYLLLWDWIRHMTYNGEQ